ncbi:hypothetical protein Q9233_016348 [Columba guinea]|nr:hypothetical protein Q9233_016348 [Columba guinea]
MIKRLSEGSQKVVVDVLRAELVFTKLIVWESRLWLNSTPGILPISKEINRKKESEAGGECLVPVNGYGHHFTQIDYLYYF